MLTVGQRVRGAHGLGTVVALNERQPNRYFQERPVEACALADAFGLLPVIVGSVYSADRYPYTVRFDTGYEDVYAEGELEVA